MQSQLYHVIQEILSNFSEEDSQKENFDRKKFRKLLKKKNLKAHTVLTNASFWQIAYCPQQGTIEGYYNFSLEIFFKHMEETLQKVSRVVENRETFKKRSDEAFFEGIDYEVFKVMKRILPSDF